MFTRWRAIPLLALFLFSLVGCRTYTSFNIPKDSKLYVDGDYIPPQKHYKYVRAPFFWTAAGGIPYALKQDGKVIDQGKIESNFRIMSIFWPPFSLIYWPMRFNNHGYDFTDKNDQKVMPDSKYMKAMHRK